MFFLVVLILNDPEYTHEILNAWEDAGVSGVTILNSTGLGRLRKAGLRDDFPLMPSLRDIFETDEIHHRTILTVVNSQALVDRLVEVTQSITGDLDQPNSGFLFVSPVLQVYGLGRGRKEG
ncbi:MAG: hypothetical protein GX495_18920 [Chloroflexi bacterium]|jgi:nitrogen regulatory protein P-II 1|nr:hypothetical protein [Chloroflexota bacterium]